MKANIIFWSGTGNTKTMAELLAKGIVEGNGEVTLKEVSEASIEDVKNCDVLLLGSPAMGDEVIEEGEMEPFIEEISGEVSGKKLVLFGSYGWGTGEWMNIWEDRMESLGAELIEREVIVNEAPEGDDEKKLIDIGLKISKY
ncbi:flavodoxin [Clostridium baratii]|uniref:flavodoxin n=1 Tax=Clostridium baratii TaxID=1561 RepID=UPI0030DFB5EE